MICLNQLDHELEMSYTITSLHILSLCHTERPCSTGIHIPAWLSPPDKADAQSTNDVKYIFCYACTHLYTANHISLIVVKGC